jgi:hypothetical protein
VRLPDEDVLKERCKALPRNRHGRRAAQVLIRRHFAAVARFKAWKAAR